MKRKILIANDGFILTNSVIYAKKIYLASGANEDEFYEITKEDYEKMLEEESGKEDIT